jgi:chromosome segregation ATPase
MFRTIKTEIHMQLTNNKNQYGNQHNNLINIDGRKFNNRVNHDQNLYTSHNKNKPHQYEIDKTNDVNDVTDKPNKDLNIVNQGEGEFDENIVFIDENNNTLANKEIFAINNDDFNDYDAKAYDNELNKLYSIIQSLQNEFKKFKDDILKNKLPVLEKSKESIDSQQFKNNEFEQKFSSFDKQMEDINLKLLDFNIFDAIKNRTTNSAENKANPDDIINFVESNQKKVFKKFEFVDDKIKKHEEEIYKLKNEILHANSHIETINLTISNSRQNVDDLNIQQIEIVKKFSELREELKKEIEGKYCEIGQNVTGKNRITEKYIEKIN